MTVQHAWSKMEKSLQLCRSGDLLCENMILNFHMKQQNFVLISHVFHPMELAINVGQWKRFDDLRLLADVAVIKQNYQSILWIFEIALEKNKIRLNHLLLWVALYLSLRSIPMFDQKHVFKIDECLAHA
jgi:hypothetical protein